MNTNFVIGVLMLFSLFILLTCVIPVKLMDFTWLDVIGLWALVIFMFSFALLAAYLIAG